MFVVPAPTIVTTPTPSTNVTVATAVLLMSYVNVPLLSLEGAVKLNGTSLKFFEGIENDVIVGAMGDTTREAVTVDPPV